VRLLDASMAHDFKGCDFGGPRCFPKGHPGTTAGVFGTFWPAAGGGPYTLHRARHTAHMRAVCARAISEASLFSSCTPFYVSLGFLRFARPPCSCSCSLLGRGSRALESHMSRVDSRQESQDSGDRSRECKCKCKRSFHLGILASLLTSASHSLLFSSSRFFSLLGYPLLLRVRLDPES
jgi:hypothetical protein